MQVLKLGLIDQISIVKGNKQRMQKQRAGRVRKEQRTDLMFARLVRKVHAEGNHKRRSEDKEKKRD